MWESNHLPAQWHFEPSHQDVLEFLGIVLWQVPHAEILLGLDYELQHFIGGRLRI
jgi:hypothetical protein